MSDENTTGTLALASYWQPALKNGKYKVTVRYDSDLGLKTEDYEKANTLDFNVYTGRFTLNPEDIYSTYPPQDATGTFSNVLPDLVLVRPTLPWERALVASEGNAPVPWLCLLLITELDKQDVRKDVCVSEMTLAQALTASAETFVPQITPDERVGETGDTLCKVLEMSAEFFHQLAPSTANLAWCAHIRKVNLDYKVTDPQIQRGIFSCLIASRLTALPPEDNRQALKHTAYLVSLEGCQGLFTDGDNKPRVRLFTLFNWSFFVQNEAFDFRTCMLKLDVGALHQPTPDMPEEMPPEEKKAIDILFRLGFTPMEHHLRNGDITLSWYRGPLCPRTPSLSQLRDREPQRVAALADEKLMFDPENGMFDVSQALAWQVGRLLSLEDQPFSRGLIRWRMTLKLHAAEACNQFVINRNMPFGLNDMAEVSPYASLFCRFLDSDEPLADPTGLRGVDYASQLQAFSSYWSKRESIDRLNDAPGSLQNDILQIWQRVAEQHNKEGE